MGGNFTDVVRDVLGKKRVESDISFATFVTFVRFVFFLFGGFDWSF